MKIISYSAPGKVIISGEHAVVYGKPAIISAIDWRLKFSVWETKKKMVDPNILLMTKIVKEYLIKNKIKFFNRTFDYKIKSDIPIRRGLGSSAAFSVAGVAAFLEFYSGKEFDQEVVNNLAHLMEKHFHKNASGVDTSTSCFGGLVYYRKEFEFLKTISALNFKIPKKIEENLFLIDSGQSKETTAEMVSFVGQLYNQKPTLIEEILNNIEKTTKRTMISIVKEDIDFFKKCLVDNQAYLELLGVVSKRATLILQRLGEFGVGKITGAGGKKTGSGYVLFFSDNKKRFETFLKEKKFSYLKFVSSSQGLI